MRAPVGQMLDLSIRAARRARTARWIATAQLKARAANARLELDIDPTAQIAPGVVLAVKHGTTNRIVIGPRCRLDDGVLLDMTGGTIVLGDNVELRRNTVLRVGGTLLFAGDDILSWGCTVHCGERIEIDRQVGASEYVTITDSRHFHTNGDEWFYGNTESSPVSIGRNVWLASKCTVLMGARIGERVVVGCHSVVGGEVPAGVLVAGTPARAIRPSSGIAHVRSA